MFGITATVGVVAANHDVALVIQEAVEDMQGFARRRRDYLGVERGEAVREVGIELAARIVAVMGIDAPGGAAETAGPEELASPLSSSCSSSSLRTMQPPHDEISAQPTIKSGQPCSWPGARFNPPSQVTNRSK